MAKAKMTETEMRQIAAQAVRGFMGSHMLDPMKFTGEEVTEHLHNFVEKYPSSIPARWFYSTGFRNGVLFCEEWDAWREAALQECKQATASLRSSPTDGLAESEDFPF